MKRRIALLGAALGIGVLMLFSGSSFAAQPEGAPASVGNAGVVEAAPAQNSAKPAPHSAQPVRISLDKTLLQNYGVVNLSGAASAGEPVYVEVWSSRTVRSDYFDTKENEKTGKTPYVLYMTSEMPAYYKILIPADKQEALEAVKAKGKSWSCSAALKDCGAIAAFKAPASIHIDRYHVSVLGSVIGSRGELLPQWTPRRSAARAMQLLQKKIHVARTLFSSPLSRPNRTAPSPQG